MMINYWQLITGDTRKAGKRNEPLPPELVFHVRRLRGKGHFYKDIAEALGVSETTCYRVINGSYRSEDQ